MSTTTDWKRITIAFCGIFVLWAIAPQHQCFCGILPVSAQTSHSCCAESSNRVGKENSSTEFQNESCCCSAEKMLSGKAKAGVSPSESGISYSKHELIAVSKPAEIGQLARIHDAELANDKLKPSRLYLLKCAFLK